MTTSTTDPAAEPAREVTEVSPDGGVVVGDDGSDAAAVAVRAAAVEAARRGCALHVLRAWTVASAERPDDVPAGLVPSLLEFEAATRRVEEVRVADLLGPDSPVPPADVRVHVVHTTSAKALLIASRTAGLLVVGSRGIGGFRNLLLGSTADQCIRYSHCSVLVVRSPETADQD